MLQDKVHIDELFALLKAWAPEEGVRRMILSDNPARCFGFQAHGLLDASP